MLPKSAGSGKGRIFRQRMWIVGSGVHGFHREAVAEMVHGEDGNPGATLPGIAGQAGLESGLPQKCLAVPPVLCGHLREQETVPALPADEKTVRSYLNHTGILYGAKRGQHRDLDVQP
jgi:hypothetical protein